MARGYAAFGLLIMVGIAVMGIVLIVSGWHTRAQERPVPGWDTTTGTVIGVHMVADKNGYVYGPIISFTDTTGGHHQFTAPTSSDEPTVGAPAQVAYDPSNPAKAHDLSDSRTSWAAPFVTGIFVVSLAGLMLVLVSWLLIHQRRRKHRLGDATARVPASPPTIALAAWIPHLSTIPLAVIVYFALQSSTHRWPIALIATAAYLAITLSVFTLAARAQRRRRSNPIGPGQPG